MQYILGIRREDKNKWERRVAIKPEHVKELREKHGIDTIIQPSDIRIFKDYEYEKVGAKISEDVSSANVIFAVKEIPSDFFERNKTYVFFSHTIKGQDYNMPMLKKMMNLECNLIDYEKITDEKGRRLVFFGRYAGLAGMIDTLWAFGKRFESKEIKTPFSQIKKTIDYAGLDDAKNHLRKIGEKIKNEGLPESISPIIVGFAGYGHVSNGAQEILDILPVNEIKPGELGKINSKNQIYKVVFKEEDIVEPISSESKFNLQEYYNKPDLYKSVFSKYLKNLSILMNCIYWDERYPRLITKDYLKKNYSCCYNFYIFEIFRYI
jgi:alpha-aminoadipic semialdehyde synthase